MSMLELKARIREYFADLGPDVADLLAVHLVDRGGFPPLFARLGVGDPGPQLETERYKTLHAAIKQRGPRKFMEEMGGLSADFQLQNTTDHSLRAQRMKILEDQLRAKARHSTEQVARVPFGPRKPAPEPSPKIQPESSVAVASPLTTGGGNTPTSPINTVSPTPQQGPSATPANATPLPPTRRSQLPKGPLQPGPAPAPEHANGPAWDPNKPYHPKGTWPEVERRSGVERRQGADRRKNVDLVYRNRRFGKDRRSPTERRRNWPKGGFRKLEDDSPPEHRS